MTTDTTAPTRPQRTRRLPYWLTSPCPAWCIEYHASDLMYDDRRHGSEQTETILTVMDAADVRHHDDRPKILTLGLTQHYRAAEPMVELLHGDGASEAVRLTLAEAEQVARDMLELVTTALRERSGHHQQQHERQEAT